MFRDFRTCLRNVRVLERADSMRSADSRLVWIERVERLSQMHAFGRVERGAATGVNPHLPPDLLITSGAISLPWVNYYHNVGRQMIAGTRAFNEPLLRSRMSARLLGDLLARKYDT